MAFGLENAGFNLKRFDDIKEELITDLKGEFGNIRTDETSKFGLLINILSQRFADVWEVLQAIYESFGIDAEGSALDDRVFWAGVVRLPAEKSRVDVSFVGTLGTVVPVGTIVKSTSTNVQFILNSSVDMSITVPAGTSLPFIALEYGDLTAPENALALVTPVSGVTSVNNPLPAVPGRFTETDDSLRIRFIQARAAIGYCRLDAMKTRIEQEVGGINSIAIFENTTGAIVNGMPPHSFEVVVDCVNSLNSAVAQKIQDVKPLGISTYGDTSESAIDALGVTRTIYFSKVVPVYAHIRITLSYSMEIYFPVDGIEQIKRNILSFVESLQIGNDMIAQSFCKPIYEVKGITGAIVEIATTPSPSDVPVFVTTNIPIDRKNKLMFDLSRITIS